MKQLFVHVDVDDVWAVGECYGLTVPVHARRLVYEGGLPRLAELLERLRIAATFFVCGKDLEEPANVDILRELVRRGHNIANHSYSHSLRFRDLSTEEMRHEIEKTHTLIQDKLGVTPRGFRAPGYGWSRILLDILARYGYAYDSSLMPSPLGGALRYLDARLTCRACGEPVRKTQYPRVSDSFFSSAPFRIVGSGGRFLWEIPVAAAPLLRIPFQASVCLSLPPAYFHFGELLCDISGQSPLTFLLHGADLTDFRRSDVPFFTSTKYFAQQVEEKERRIEGFLKSLLRNRVVTTTEVWVEEQYSCL